VRAIMAGRRNEQPPVVITAATTRDRWTIAADRKIADERKNISKKMTKQQWYHQVLRIVLQAKLEGEELTTP